MGNGSFYKGEQEQFYLLKQMLIRNKKHINQKIHSVSHHMLAFRSGTELQVMTVPASVQNQWSPSFSYSRDMSKRIHYWEYREIEI